MEAGGSTVVAVHALQANSPSADEIADGNPLVYHNRTWHRLDESSRIA
jgi:hypothetical protein